MIKRILALLHARNTEYVRDRSSLGWGIAFPVLMVLGMAAIFSGGEKPIFKVAVYNEGKIEQPQLQSSHRFLSTRYIHFFPVEDLDTAIVNVARHKIDLLLDLDSKPLRYWVNPSSPKSYIIEKILLASEPSPMQRIDTENQQIRYVDWLVPGILGMNMMFGCLFGIGYVIVRYRKNGYLKRISATPISAIEFMTAQIGSRLIISLLTSIIVFVGVDLFIDFPMHGSYLNLILVAVLGATAMSALGLVFAARVANEELANGLINIVLWPMMILSGVWFSLEGAPAWIQTSAELLPLTHLVEGGRKIMLDGAGLSDISYHLVALALMSLLFLTLGAVLFKWTQD